jgi:hypothetical protein
MTFNTISKKIIDDAQAHLSVSELANSPLGVLAGLSHTDGKQAMDALDAKTVSDFAQSRFVLWAQAVTTLARTEKSDMPNPGIAAILDEKWQKKKLRDIAKASPAVFAGLSEKEAKVLAEVFGIRTVEDLATNRYVRKAQAVAYLAMIEKEDSFRKAA